MVSAFLTTSSSVFLLSLLIFANSLVSCCVCCNCCWSTFWCFDSQFMFPVYAFAEGFIRGLCFTVFTDGFIHSLSFWGFFCWRLSYLCFFLWFSFCFRILLLVKGWSFFLCQLWCCNFCCYAPGQRWVSTLLFWTEFESLTGWNYHRCFDFTPIVVVVDIADIVVVVVLSMVAKGFNANLIHSPMFSRFWQFQNTTNLLPFLLKRVLHFET